MLLATRYCVILAMLATLISLLSMGTVHFFDHLSPSQGSNWDWVSELGDWIVCILWIGGSMGFLAWAKVWVGNASFNSGASPAITDEEVLTFIGTSMAAVTLYTVIIKEGNLPKLTEVLLIVLIGGAFFVLLPSSVAHSSLAIIANIVCYIVFPSSATSRLQSSISKSLSSFSTLLDLLTSTFLLEKTVIKGKRSTLKDAVQSHATAFKTLKSDLSEAKHERMLDPRIRGRKLELYDAAVGSLTRLAQHLASLRGSTKLQESLILAIKDGRINADVEPEKQFSTISLSALRHDRSSGPGVLLHADISGSIRLFLQFREIAGAQMDTLVVSQDFLAASLMDSQTVTMR